MSLLGDLLAGGLKGAGAAATHIGVEGLAQKREEAKLRMQQEFQTSERVAKQEWESGENKLQRKHETDKISQEHDLRMTEIGADNDRADARAKRTSEDALARTIAEHNMRLAEQNLRPITKDDVQWGTNDAGEMVPYYIDRKTNQPVVLDNVPKPIPDRTSATNRATQLIKLAGQLAEDDPENPQIADLRREAQILLSGGSGSNDLTKRFAGANNPDSNNGGNNGTNQTGSFFQQLMKDAGAEFQAPGVGTPTPIPIPENTPPPKSEPGLLDAARQKYVQSGKAFSEWIRNIPEAVSSLFGEDIPVEIQGKVSDTIQRLANGDSVDPAIAQQVAPYLSDVWRKKLEKAATTK